MGYFLFECHFLKLLSTVRLFCDIFSSVGVTDSPIGSPFCSSAAILATTNQSTLAVQPMTVVRSPDRSPRTTLTASGALLHISLCAPEIVEPMPSPTKRTELATAISTTMSGPLAQTSIAPATSVPSNNTPEPSFVSHRRVSFSSQQPAMIPSQTTTTQSNRRVSFSSQQPSLIGSEIAKITPQSSRRVSFSSQQPALIVSQATSTQSNRRVSFSSQQPSLITANVPSTHVPVHSSGRRVSISGQPPVLIGQSANRRVSFSCLQPVVIVPEQVMHTSHSAQSSRRVSFCGTQIQHSSPVPVVLSSSRRVSFSSMQPVKISAECDPDDTATDSIPFVTARQPRVASVSDVLSSLCNIDTVSFKANTGTTQMANNVCWNSLMTYKWPIKLSAFVVPITCNLSRPNCWFCRWCWNVLVPSSPHTGSTSLVEPHADV